MLEVNPETAQEASRDRLVLPDDGEQDVLGADVRLTQVHRLLQRQHHQPLRPRRERDHLRTVPITAPTVRTTRSRATGSDTPSDRNTETAPPPSTASRPSQQVLTPDVVVLQPPRFRLSQDDDPTGLLGEPVIHPASIPSIALSVAPSRRRVRVR